LGHNDDLVPFGLQAFDGFDSERLVAVTTLDRT
jgi:hypothetical protein